MIKRREEMNNPSEHNNSRSGEQTDHVDDLLHRLPIYEIDPEDLLAVRRTLNAANRSKDDSGMMTLKEVADFLRISQFELESILPDLPAFELAGQLRVRRNRLNEWIENRENEYVRAGIRNAVQKELTLINKEVVA